MNWDAIGATAELMAAVGVIISLVFVGLQVKKSNAEARLATIQATTDTESRMLSTFARHAETWNKVNTGQPLEGAIEIRRGIVLFNLLMMANENRYHHFLAGNLDARSWQNRLMILDDVVLLPVFSLWRESLGARSLSADYLDLVDRIARKAGVDS